MKSRFALQYGLRNLRRHPRRTVLTVAAVALSATVSIVGDRLTTASFRVFKDSVIEFGGAHAQLRTVAAWKSQQALSRDHLVQLSPETKAQIAAESGVVGTSERLRFSAIISSGRKSIYFFGNAFSPEQERIVSPKIFAPGYCEGEFISDGKPDGVVVGRLLAESLALKIGDSATVLAQTLDGQAASFDVQVIGIADPPSNDISRRLVYMPLALGRQAVGIDSAYTELAVRLRPEASVERWVDQTKPLVGADILALGWYDLFPYVPRLEKALRSITGVTSFLILLAAGFAVLNIVYLTVEERTIEIGTLMALGARARDVWWLFVAEATLIGAVGSVLALVAGNVIVAVAGVAGVPFQNPFAPGLIYVYPEASLATSFAVAASATAICWAAAFLPALGSTRVDPVSAFRRLVT